MTLVLSTLSLLRLPLGVGAVIVGMLWALSMVGGL